MADYNRPFLQEFLSLPAPPETIHRDLFNGVWVAFDGRLSALIEYATAYRTGGTRAEITIGVETFPVLAADLVAEVLEDDPALDLAEAIAVAGGSDPNGHFVKDFVTDLRRVLVPFGLVGKPKRKPPKKKG